MYTPTSEELDAAINMLADTSTEVDRRLHSAMGESKTGVMLWGSVIAGAMAGKRAKRPASAEEIAELAENTLDIVKSAPQEVKDAAREGINAGIQLGVAIMEARNGTAGAPLARPIITAANMEAAATMLALDKIRGESLQGLTSAYEAVKHNDTFLKLAAMAYGMFRKIGPGEIDKAQIKKDGELTRGLAMAIVLGMLVGVRIPLANPVPGEPVETETPIRGGWK